MSKKNRNTWQKQNASQSPVAAPAPEISAAQLAANQANAQLSSGPVTEAGKAKSSLNALKSGLTGRTVLLPTDNVEEYTAFLSEFQQDLQPLGKMECELVQIVVDCHWRLRRIQELEEAFYARGQEQFADAVEEKYAGKPASLRRSMVVLETHLAYQKELRNLHIQEARIDRKRRKALDELKQLQSDRQQANASAESSDSDHTFKTDEEFFAAINAGYVPPSIAESYAKLQQRDFANGSEFSSASLPQSSDGAIAS